MSVASRFGKRIAAHFAYLTRQTDSLNALVVSNVIDELQDNLTSFKKSQKTVIAGEIELTASAFKILRVTKLSEEMNSLLKKGVSSVQEAAQKDAISLDYNIRQGHNDGYYAFPVTLEFRYKQASGPAANLQ